MTAPNLNTIVSGTMNQLSSSISDFTNAQMKQINDARSRASQSFMDTSKKINQLKSKIPQKPKLPDVSKLSKLVPVIRIPDTPSVPSFPDISSPAQMLLNMLPIPKLPKFKIPVDSMKKALHRPDWKGPPKLESLKSDFEP